MSKETKLQLFLFMFLVVSGLLFLFGGTGFKEEAQKATTYWLSGFFCASALFVFKQFLNSLPSCQKTSTISVGEETKKVQ